MSLGRKIGGGSMSESRIWTPKSLDEALIFIHTHAEGAHYWVKQDYAIDPSSKSPHYAIFGFGGAQLRMHEEDGTYRPWVFRNDLEAARLIYTAEYFGVGSLPLSLEDIVLSVPNLTVMNNFGNGPLISLESGMVTDAAYIRQFVFLLGSNNIKLVNADRLNYGLIISPQDPYYGKNRPKGPVAVLHFPEARSLPDAHLKESKNYSFSTRGVTIKNTVFLPWLERERPQMFVVDQNGNRTELDERQKDEMIAYLRPRLAEVLYHDEYGRPMECSADNIAIIKDGQMLSPDVKTKRALPGWTMQIGEGIASSIGLETKRENFDFKSLLGSDGFYMTGNACGMEEIDAIAECEWDYDEQLRLQPKGPVTIYKVGNAQGSEKIARIKEEYEKIRAGRGQEYGNFGFYVDECFNAGEIKELHEKAREMMRLRKEAKCKSAPMLAEAGRIFGDIAAKPATFGIPGGLLGRLPPNFKTTIKNGELRYAKMLGVK